MKNLTLIVLIALLFAGCSKKEPRSPGEDCHLCIRETTDSNVGIGFCTNTHDTSRNSNCLVGPVTNIVDFLGSSPVYIQAVLVETTWSEEHSLSSHCIAVGINALSACTNSYCIGLGRNAEPTNDSEIVVRFTDGTEFRAQMPMHKIVDLVLPFR